MRLGELVNPAQILVGLEWHQRQAQTCQATAPHFPPRRDKRRRSIASVHRRVLDWLRGAAIRDLIGQDLIAQFRPKMI